MLKILKDLVKNIIFISIFLFIDLNAQVLFTPFNNQTSFTGKWNLEIEVPNYLAAYFREFYKLDVLSSTAYLSLIEETTNPERVLDIENISQFAKEMNFSYVVFGTIQEFDIKRYVAGELQVGGYEGYSSSIECEIKIFDINENKIVFTQLIDSKVTKDQLGLTLLGRPTNEKEQFYQFDNIPFGGEEFSKTIVGESMITFSENVCNAIKEIEPSILLYDLKQKPKVKVQDKSLDDIFLNAEVIKGYIITYDVVTGEAFINIGSSNKLKAGEEFGIYTQSDSLFDPVTKEFIGLGENKIGSLEILEVRGEKFSLAIIKDNRENIKKGMLIKKILVKTN
jgi:hypothetical protein